MLNKQIRRCKKITCLPLKNTKIEQADTPSLYFVFMYQSYSSVVRPWHQVNQVVFLINYFQNM